MPLYLDTQYARLVGSRLHLFKTKGPNLFNFRCPFCGDSTTNKYKSRAYLYEDEGSLAFKCHNCAVSMGFRFFLMKIDESLAAEYRLEVFKATHSTSRIAWQTTSFQNSQSPIFHSLCVSPLGSPLSALPPTHPARMYCYNRGLPDSCLDRFHYTMAMDRLASLAPEKYTPERLGRDERILIPFYSTAGDLIGLSGRAMYPSKLRYVTMRLREGEPLIFGLNRWQSASFTYLTEGAFDSVFLPNALAAGGLDFKRALTLMSVNRSIIVFDNQPRNKQVVAQMSNLISGGWSVVVWPRSWHYKDINDAIQAGCSSSDVLEIINTNVQSGLGLQLAISHWQR